MLELGRTGDSPRYVRLSHLVLSYCYLSSSVIRGRRITSASLALPPAFKRHQLYCEIIQVLSGSAILVYSIYSLRQKPTKSKSSVITSVRPTNAISLVISTFLSTV